MDDNPAILSSLELLLASSTVTVRTFANGRQLYAALNKDHPDCLVLDYQLPDADGLAVQTYLADNRVHVPIVFFSGTNDIQVAVAAMRRGAVDFIEKPCADDQLMSAVVNALDTRRAQQARRCVTINFSEAILTLSPRERQVCDALSHGLRNKHIARQFDISPRTVETHRANAMRKLCVRNSAELIRVYVLTSTVWHYPPCAPQYSAGSPA